MFGHVSKFMCCVAQLDLLHPLSYAPFTRYNRLYSVDTGLQCRHSQQVKKSFIAYCGNK